MSKICLYRNRKRHRTLLFSVLCLFAFCLVAQKPLKDTTAQQGEKKEVSAEVKNKQRNKVKAKKRRPRKTKSDNRVYLLHSDVLRKDYRVPNAQVLVGNVKFRHDSLYMYCDSALYYDQSNSFHAFGNVKMEQGDTLFLYGDQLYYDGVTQIAQMRMNVRMENRKTTLLTDSLNFDRVYNLGYYFDGGTLMDDQNVLTSEWGEYNPSTKQSVFNYNVKLVNPDYTLTTDTLRYNTATNVANIVGPSDIISDKSHIYSERGFYNTNTGRAQLYNRSIVTNEGKSMVGDTLFYDQKKGIGEAFHNMELKDTVNKNILTGDYGFYNEKTGYAIATKRAVAIDYSQKDSLFLHADTLMLKSFYLDTDSMYREMRAYHKVRFFRKDVQGVADSMVFSTKDSCLTMYDNPILWQEKQQILGETIKAYVNDSTIDWAHIINQALAIEQVDSIHYNQVSGKEMKAFFKDQTIDRAEVNGSVRMVFYPLEKDGSLTGVMNLGESSKLDIYMKKGQMERMVMRTKPVGTLYPVLQIPIGKDKLDSFVWFDYIRPKNKEDIFEWVGKKSGQELKQNTRGPIQLPNQHLFDKLKK